MLQHMCTRSGNFRALKKIKVLVVGDGLFAYGVSKEKNLTKGISIMTYSQ